MGSITRWHTAWWWAVAAGWLVGMVAAVSAQGGRWEHTTAAGMQAFAQGEYVEAARQFQAALPCADAGSLATSLLHLAAVYDAQGQYTDAARLYQRALRLQEQILGPDHPQLLPVLEAQAALARKQHPVQSLLPWSAAQRTAARARRIQEREARGLLQTFPWGEFHVWQIVGDGASGE